MKHIVIAGGGFAGVRTARRLKKQKDIRITLINDSEDFRYCPALYRAATGHKLGTARLPLEWMLLDNSNTSVIIGKVSGIDSRNRILSLDDKTELAYDYAVLALGSVTTYFNIEGLHEHAFGIKTAEEIIALRQHLHEKIAAKSTDEANYVIVGGGPTGVELAGALGSYLRKIARRHRSRRHNITIWLVEAAPRILPQMHPMASESATKRLRKLGVRIAADTKVNSETINSLKTSSGNIKTHTVIWTAGTQNNPFYKDNDHAFKLNERGKVNVDDHLQALPNVYVIGDNAATAHSGAAYTAIKHADFIAKEITARVHGKRRPDHHEPVPIQIVPAGKRWAVLQYRSLVMSGWVAYLFRKLADYIGYSDVLGYLKALTIWSHSEQQEEYCRVCQRT